MMDAYLFSPPFVHKTECHFALIDDDSPHTNDNKQYELVRVKDYGKKTRYLCVSTTIYISLFFS